MIKNIYILPTYPNFLQYVTPNTHTHRYIYIYIYIQYIYIIYNIYNIYIYIIYTYIYIIYIYIYIYMYYMLGQKHEELSLIPVDTRLRFNIDTTSCDVVCRRIDVETTSLVYRDRLFVCFYLNAFYSSSCARVFLNKKIHAIIPEAYIILQLNIMMKNFCENS